MSPRLPNPGQDDGVWGDLLNNYLSVAHQDDGSIKDGAVGAGAIQDNSITASQLAPDSVGTSQVADDSVTEQKLSSAVQTKLNQTAPVTSVNGETGAVSLTAAEVSAVSTSEKAAANGVATLDGTGKVIASQVPDLSGTYLKTAGTNTVTLPDSTTQFLRVDIPDDGSPSSGWPDRHANFFNGTRTGYFNEYGEIRARPGKTNTVALRAMGHGSGSTGNIFEVAAGSLSQVYMGVSSSQVTLTVPLSTDSTVTAPNVGSSRVFASPAANEPGGPRSVGDIWIKY